jgi:3-methylcrotonyl-CoA carboxylase alpha subunit
MSRLRTLLIANRGEIAVRVARTARAMGIETVAVYSEPDRGALHVRECDRAYAIGEAPALASYLNVDALLRAARAAGADSVHPGYGFLSQNGDFADAVAAAGLVFVGPPGPVHRRMGDKKAARRLMATAGVPVVPGYDGDDQQDATLLGESRRIGWPVMLKPSRGGGGKGMRVITAEDGFASALAASRREAKAAFGDEAMVVERFLARPRHVEVQVLADGHGAIVHLGERECSLQRRHQKVVEESPSPALDEDARKALCAAGVAAAKAASYVNAGTVEFLLDEDGKFFFLEMNTRLQVEHPVTEAVTGLDLVRLQLEVAAGARLPFAQDALVRRGHALECRVYAEDADRGDLPSPGRLLAVSWPVGPGVRVDAGVAAGDEVSVHYDPLLAKVVTWGASRGESLERMAEALRRTAVLGVATNQGRLRAIVDHPAFRAGRLHTGFLGEHFADAEPPTSEPPPEAVAALAAALRAGSPRSSSGAAAPSTAGADAFDRVGAWRLGTSS